MKNRAAGFVSLLAVIGVSIVFGMLLGGRLNAPNVSLAAPGAEPVLLAPAITTTPGLPSFADIVEAAMPAVVSVRSANLPDEQRRGEQPDRPSPEEWFWRRFFGDPEPRDPRRRNEPRIGEGSGFLISEDGYLLTNYHVVEEADDVRVGLTNGKEFRASVVGTDPSIDLALLKVDAKGERLPTLPLGDSGSLRVGEWVIAIGNPLEFEQTVTVGVVSAKERRVPIGNTDSGVVSFIQTDAAINFGNSGGPLLDGRGNVIGINTAIRRANFAEGIGFALPINHARNVIEQLRERGFVKRGYIGITMNQNGVDEAAREWLGLPDSFGVIVDDVAKDGPADRAGVRRGDVIRKVDGEEVRDNLDLISKIASHQPGDAVNLEIFRKEGERGRTLKLTATLQDREEGLRASVGSRPGTPTPPAEPEPTEATALGVTVTNLGATARRRLGLDDSQSGVLVTDVAFNSQAQSKGIVADMVVTSINDRPVKTVDDWKRIVDGLAPGTPCKLEVLVGPSRTVTVYLRVPEAN